MGERRSKGKSHWAWWVVGILLVLVVVLIAIPNLLHRHLMESRAESPSVSSMRAICTANVSYEYGHPKQGYARTLADLGPKDGNYLDARLATGEKAGYRFEYTAKPGANGLIEQYRVTARPERHGKTGQVSLYMDENCEIRSTTEDRAPTAADPKL
ncbi:MAG: hypothetical protein HYX28_07665 [Candidatus Koribacter versatilis]|uniref:Uncharacterized protein n=1 Tax=Candidatus Korobacter versatilis TaxID=658062 RepID=A0A932EPB3_9BACT|nr:hypothetical protein [Candidatus Koribacter versatilis]